MPVFLPCPPPQKFLRGRRKDGEEEGLFISPRLACTVCVPADSDGGYIEREREREARADGPASVAASAASAPHPRRRRRTDWPFLLLPMPKHLAQSPQLAATVKTVWAEVPRKGSPEKRGRKQQSRMQYVVTASYANYRARENARLFCSCSPSPARAL